MKRTFFVLFMALLSKTLSSQIPEIKEVKRFMSLGEKEGFKIVLPTQEIDKFQKTYNKFLKANNAEPLKSPKGSSESIYNRLFLKGLESPVILFVVMEQEGKNVGWTGYFFNEKDSSKTENKIAIKEFIGNVYNASMYQLYEDSINAKQREIKDANSQMNTLSKEAQKCQKNAISAKDKIREAEAQIEKSKALLNGAQAKLPELESAISKTKSSLSAAQTEMKKIGDVENEIKEMVAKYKKMNKNLAELQKDPTTNANLIVATDSDMGALKETMAKRQMEFKSMESTAKTNLKSAERDVKNAESEFKKCDKTIKNENDRISDANLLITDKRKVIEENEKQVEEYNNSEKTKAEVVVKVLESSLLQLQEAQKAFKTF